MCEWNLECPNDGTRVVGELVVCSSHAGTALHTMRHVANGSGEVLCWCGYWKPKGAECGEPCL